MIDKLELETTFDRSWLRQLLVMLITIKIVGIILIFDIGGLQAFDFPKSLFSRSMEWLILGVLAVAIVRFGFGILPRTRLHLVAAAFVLAYALSALFAENRYIALYGDRDRYLGLTFVVDMAVLYLAIAVGFRRLADWGVFAAGVGVASVLVIGYAWIQYFGLDPIAWSADPGFRPFSTLGHPDHLGHYLSLLFGAAVGVAVVGGKTPISARAVAGLLCLGVLATAAVIATRGTLLGIAATVAVLPFAQLRARAAGNRTVAAAALAVVASISILAGLVAFTPLGERTQAVEGANSVASRLVVFGAAARMFLDRPLLGYGPDEFGIAFPRYREPENARVLGDAYQNSAHDWLLQAAATTGLAGVLAAVALAASSIVGLWKAAAPGRGVIAWPLLLASVGYWAHASVTVGSISVDWLPWVALGGIASVAPRSVASTARRGPLVAFAGVALAVGAILGAMSGWPALAANRAAGVARQEAATRPQTAIAAGESAVRQDGGRAEYWDWLGAAYGASGRWREAAAAEAEAAARAPHDWVYWANLATSYVRGATAEGDDQLLRDGLAAARHAVEVDPYEPRVHIVLAQTASAAASYDLALSSAATAISLDPRQNVDELVAFVAARATDLPRAKELLEEMVRLRDTARLHLTFAEVALRLGDLSTARVHARRALELVPANPEAQQILRMTGG
ncbi:MAG: O-antigen ligase family protein [Chloroflexota bacterium]